MEIIQTRDPLYVGRHGPWITLGGIQLTPAKAREIGERLVMLSNSFDADDVEVLEPPEVERSLDRDKYQVER